MFQVLLLTCLAGAASAEYVTLEQNTNLVAQRNVRGLIVTPGFRTGGNAPPNFLGAITIQTPRGFSRVRLDFADFDLETSAQCSGDYLSILEPEGTHWEVRLKLHWVAFAVSNDVTQRVFSEFGEVKKVAHERWRVPGFEGAESTTRIVRLVLREGVNLDRLPHQLRLGGGSVLVVVPGRAPMCLWCRMTGHIRRGCRAPKCTECRAFGHERADCVRSYAQAAGRGAHDETDDHLMDEEEAETAATSTMRLTEKPKKDEVPDNVTERANAPSPEKPSTEAPTTPLAGEHQTATSPCNVEAGAAPVPDVDPAGQKMDVEVGAAKRPLEDVTGATQERRLRQIEKWRVVAGLTGAEGLERPLAPKGHEKLSQ
ncbi:hypothetical protein ISCGN_003381 [Ixodes scapularis]